MFKIVKEIAEFGKRGIALARSGPGENDVVHRTNLVPLLQLSVTLLSILSPEYKLDESETRVGVLDRKYKADLDVDCCDLCRVPRSTGHLNRCARCKVGKYCSMDCQKEDWKRHKGVCVKRE